MSLTISFKSYSVRLTSLEGLIHNQAGIVRLH